MPVYNLPTVKHTTSLLKSTVLTKARPQKQDHSCKSLAACVWPQKKSRISVAAEGEAQQQNCDICTVQVGTCTVLGIPNPPHLQKNCHSHMDSVLKNLDLDQPYLLDLDLYINYGSSPGGNINRDPPRSGNKLRVADPDPDRLDL